MGPPVQGTGAGGGTHSMRGMRPLPWPRARAQLYLGAGYVFWFGLPCSWGQLPAAWGCTAPGQLCVGLLLLTPESFHAAAGASA
jgi:hypothetical protein